MTTAPGKKQKVSLWRIACMILVCLLFVYAAVLWVVPLIIYPRKYTEIVEAAAKEFDIPTAMVYAVVKTESGFDPKAVSSAGAVGLMQIMPETAANLASDLGQQVGDLTAVRTNIRFGCCYLSQLYQKYGSWENTLAAYNAGPGVVDVWLENQEYTDPSGKLSRIPYQETENYLYRVLTAYGEYQRLYRGD